MLGEGWATHRIDAETNAVQATRLDAPFNFASTEAKTE
jgi:hypothetical protein